MGGARWLRQWQKSTSSGFGSKSCDRAEITWAAKIAVSDARSHQIEESIGFGQGAPVSCQHGNQEVAEPTIRAECSGVDSPHGLQEGRHIHWGRPAVPGLCAWTGVVRKAMSCLSAMAYMRALKSSLSSPLTVSSWLQVWHATRTPCGRAGSSSFHSMTWEKCLSATNVSGQCTS